MAEYNANLGEDWSQVAQLLQWERGVQADRQDEAFRRSQMERQSKMDEQVQAEQAIRWQGEQDYKTLVDSGVDPMVAFGRTAPKLFHNDPRGLASAIESMRPRSQYQRPEATPITVTEPSVAGSPVVRRSYTEAGYDAKLIEDAVAAELATRKAAQAKKATLANSPLGLWDPRGWFGANPDVAINSTSNRLTAAGRNPETGEPIPPSFKGASGGYAPAATPEMIAAFKSLPPTSPTAPGPAQMPSATPAQAQAAIQSRFPVSPSTETVVVIGPNGKRGRIPKIQLDDALKQGFTLPK
jgi:hypothetical protein